MRNLQVMGKVTYKQVVTESYKEKARKEVENEISNIDDEVANFDKQMSKTITELTLKAHPQTEALRQQFNAEREKILLYKEQLKESIKTIDDLEMGARVDAGEGNFVSELAIGDSFTEKLSCEVVVEDDVIVEINGTI